MNLRAALFFILVTVSAYAQGAWTQKASLPGNYPYAVRYEGKIIARGTIVIGKSL